MAPHREQGERVSTGYSTFSYLRDLGQGYLFARPMPAGEVVTVIED